MRGVESDNDRLRLRKCSNKFDNFGFASAIENKFSWHLACTKFGIPLGLHYLCLVAKIGFASEMLKYF